MTEESGKPDLSVVIPTMGRPVLIQTLKSLAETPSAGRMEVLVAGHIRNETISRQFSAFSSEFQAFKHLDVSFTSGDSSNKKNSGLHESTADIVAFIDDDVSVVPEWPERILESFVEESVGMVSGPSLIPDDLPVMARLSGMALASPAAGYVAERYQRGHDGARRIKWSRIIGCNMAFRKSVLLELGGFDPRFWPGEEMVAASNVSKRGHHIVFQPEACLYHYPRATLTGFVRQIYGYGATRIRLIREGLDFEFTTVVPAIWVASVILLGFAALFCRWCLILLGLNLAFYLFADLVVTLITFCKSRRGVDLMLFLLIPAMHVSYGLAEWMELFRPDVDLSEGVDRTKDTASGSPTAHEDVKAEEGV